MGNQRNKTKSQKGYRDNRRYVKKENRKQYKLRGKGGEEECFLVFTTPECNVRMFNEVNFYTPHAHLTWHVGSIFLIRVV